MGTLGIRDRADGGVGRSERDRGERKRDGDVGGRVEIGIQRMREKGGDGRGI